MPATSSIHFTCPNITSAMATVEEELREIVIDTSVADQRHAAAAADGERAAGAQQWPPLEPSIYRVPGWIRDRDSSAYNPEFVSFGPYHHRATERLRYMEKYKQDALTSFSRRADKSQEEIKRAVGGLVHGLMGSYDGLDEKWRDNHGEEFRDLMTLDGCFLLEILFGGYGGHAASKKSNDGYPESHPVFGRKGAYLMQHIRRDMLLLENQLPLKLLQELAKLLPAGEIQHNNIREMGLKFLADGKLLVESDQWVPPPPTTIEALFYIMPMYYLLSPIDPLPRLLQMLLGKIRDHLQETGVGRALLALLPPRTTAAHASPSNMESLAPHGMEGAYVKSPQLPAAEGSVSPIADILRRLLPWLRRHVKQAKASAPEAIHILDMYKQSMLLQGVSSRGGQVPFSAEQLSHFGVKFQVANTGSFQDVEFGRGRRRLGLEFFYVVPLVLFLPPPLRLPVLRVDDDTLPTLLNLMAFERLYHGTGNEVNNYLLLMGSLVRSVEDVNALVHHGIVLWGPGKDSESVHKIFAEIMKKALPVDVADRGELYSRVAAYCNTRTARIVRWFRSSKPPPLVGHILTILALVVALFTALSRYIFK